MEHQLETEGVSDLKLRLRTPIIPFGSPICVGTIGDSLTNAFTYSTSCRKQAKENKSISKTNTSFLGCMHIVARLTPLPSRRVEAVRSFVPEAGHICHKAGVGRSKTKVFVAIKDRWPPALWWKKLYMT
jgi:hypothetical protein